MARLSLVTLTAAIAACDALRVPFVAQGLHASRTLSRTPPLFMEEDAEPAVETPPPAPPPPAKDTYDPPSDFKFLGLTLDTNEPGGALGASLIVSVGFCIVVEGIKFLDPSNAGDTSIFGSITTAGL